MAESFLFYTRSKRSFTYWDNAGDLLVPYRSADNVCRLQTRAVRMVRTTTADRRSRSVAVALSTPSDLSRSRRTRGRRVSFFRARANPRIGPVLYGSCHSVFFCPTALRTDLDVSGNTRFVSKSRARSVHASTAVRSRCGIRRREKTPNVVGRNTVFRNDFRRNHAIMRGHPLVRRTRIKNASDF